MIPIIASVRGILFTSIILITLGVFVVLNSTKEKPEYEKRTGKIEYLEETYLNLPNRNLGNYRYLRINSYEYVFEIYIANSSKGERSIDELKVGDIIDTYFYETGNTHSEEINRYIQFIDKNEKPYFIRGNFQEQLGYVILGLVLLLNIGSFILWQRGKIVW